MTFVRSPLPRAASPPPPEPPPPGPLQWTAATWLWPPKEPTPWVLGEGTYHIHTQSASPSAWQLTRLPIAASLRASASPPPEGQASGAWPSFSFQSLPLSGPQGLAAGLWSELLFEAKKGWRGVEPPNCRGRGKHLCLGVPPPEVRDPLQSGGRAQAPQGHPKGKGCPLSLARLFLFKQKYPT